MLKVESKLAKVSKSQTSKYTGRQEYLRELLSMAAGWKKQGRISGPVPSRQIMAQHGQSYEGLSWEKSKNWKPLLVPTRQRENVTCWWRGIGAPGGPAGSKHG